MVTDVHLSAMIQAAVVEGVIDIRKADYWWREAKWQNLYALHCRYRDPLEIDGEPIEEPQDIPSERTSVEAPLRPEVIEHIIACWGYQCAEFDGYDDTRISHVMDQVVATLKAKYPDMDWEQRDLPWGISDWAEVTQPTTHHLHLVPSTTTTETP